MLAKEDQSTATCDMLINSTLYKCVAFEMCKRTDIQTYLCAEGGKVTRMNHRGITHLYHYNINKLSSKSKNMHRRRTCWEEERNRLCCILKMLSTESICGTLFLRRAASIYNIYIVFIIRNYTLVH